MNKGTPISQVQCRISSVTLMSEDILHIEIKADEEFELADFLELMEAAKEIGNGKKFKNLIKVGIHTLPSREAREMSSSTEGSEFKLADAFVIHSVAQKIIGNFMMNIQKPAIPTRIFTDENEALIWLNNLD